MKIKAQISAALIPINFPCGRLFRKLNFIKKSKFKTWRRWRDIRNSTSHAYDEERALEVAVAASAFVADVDSLLTHLESLVSS